ncbi:hypothetical protein NDU88_003638 [Pleurodeles waltl]|uniref:Secreted protein n=1 Tax=Pleurodeles waltl TaxID=8319 RepID=A0AAV7UD49_PLEWA|nr:hypothetical protein NDU88_003638 [Pleurodeles waltl]
MWVMRCTVVAGRLFLFGCPILPSGSSAQFAAGGGPRGAPIQARSPAIPAASSVPATSFCGLVLKRSLRDRGSLAVAGHLSPPAALSLGPGLKCGPCSRKAASSPPQAAPHSLGARSRGTNFRCAPRGSNTTLLLWGTGGPLPARTGPRTSEALIRVAREQRAPPVHPQLSRIIRMRHRALEARVRHV